MHALQSSVKRAHKYDEYHEINLGTLPYDDRLDQWGETELSQTVQSQPLQEMYDSYAVNDDLDSDSESTE